MFEGNGVPGSPRLFEGVLEVDGVLVGPENALCSFGESTLVWWVCGSE